MSEPTHEVLVELVGVSKNYRSGDVVTHVLRDVDLRVHRGECLAVLGASGCGKTTLLNLIGALDMPTSGRIVVDGQAISEADERARTEFRRQKIGFIFQFYNLLPTLFALENVEVGLEVLPLPASEIRDRARRYLEPVGLRDKADKLPSELSGGEQQRVAIARALAKQPPLILADEPTGNLDEDTGVATMRLMRQLHREQHATLVLVTHNPRIAEFADRVVRIDRGHISETAVDPSHPAL